MRARRVELAGVHVALASDPRRDDAVFDTGVTALPVDDHRRGQYQALQPGLVHGRQQHGRAHVVVLGVGRRVRRVDPVSDHGRLVAHHVDIGEEFAQQSGVAHVADDEPVPPGPVRRARVAVRLGQQGIDADHLVPALDKRHPRCANR